MGRSRLSRQHQRFGARLVAAQGSRQTHGKVFGDGAVAWRGDGYPKTVSHRPAPAFTNKAFFVAGFMIPGSSDDSSLSGSLGLLLLLRSGQCVGRCALESATATGSHLDLEDRKPDGQ